MEKRIQLHRASADRIDATSRQRAIFALTEAQLNQSGAGPEERLRAYCRLWRDGRLPGEAGAYLVLKSAVEAARESGAVTARLLRDNGATELAVWTERGPLHDLPPGILAQLERGRQWVISVPPIGCAS